MLLSLSEVHESDSILDRPYLGVVFDNKDPLKLGRVKCTIDGLIDQSEDAPWITRKSDTFLGGNTTSGRFSTPEIGSELKIEFPYKDVYSAEYSGFWNSVNSTTSEAGEPEKVVFAHIEDLKVNYDKASKELEVTHPSGTKITLKANGDVEILAQKNILLNGGEENSKVITVESDPVVDYITGVPSVGVARVKAGLV